MSAYEGYTGHVLDDNAQWNRDFESAKAQLQQQQPDMARMGMAGRQLSNQQELAPKRPAELPVVASTLTERISMLMKIFTELEKRLTPVLRLQPPTTAEVNKATTDYGASTQLGGMIAQAAGNVDVVINRVRDLLDRLEL